MRSIAQLILPLKAPIGILPYFDKVQVWVREPLDRLTLRKLRKECGKGGLFHEIGPSRFKSHFRQRIEFRQPSDFVLKRLAHFDDCLINRLEAAIDFIFACPTDRDDAYEFFHRHMVRRWHGCNQEIRAYCAEEGKPIRASIEESESRYDAGRWVPNRITSYKESYSRATGELYCLHVEWRANGVRACRRAGIRTPVNLVEFDHRAFWDRRLLLLDIEPRKIGRRVRKKGNLNWGGNSNLDGKIGGIFLNSVDTLQELLDEYGAALRLGRIAKRFECESWLPGIIGSSAHSLLYTKSKRPNLIFMPQSPLAS